MLMGHPQAIDGMGGGKRIYVTGSTKGGVPTEQNVDLITDVAFVTNLDMVCSTVGS